LLQNLKTPKEIYENPDILPGEATVEKLNNKLSKPVLISKKKKEVVQEETTQTTEGETDTKIDTGLLQRLPSSII